MQLELGTIFGSTLGSNVIMGFTLAYTIHATETMRRTVDGLDEKVDALDRKIAKISQKVLVVLQKTKLDKLSGNVPSCQNDG